MYAGITSPATMVAHGFPQGLILKIEKKAKSYFVTSKCKLQKCQCFRTPDVTLTLRVLSHLLFLIYFANIVSHFGYIQFIT